MRLIVGPGDHRQDLVASSQAAWEAFVTKVGTVPVSVSSVTFEALGRSSSGVASSFLFAGPRCQTEQALIVLSAAFFDKPLGERNLTLLHECIHLRFMGGPLRERVIEAIELDRIHRTPTVTDDDEQRFLDHRYHLAFSLRNVVDEILAELYLKAEHPTFLRERIVYYLGMRRASLASWKQAAATLRPYALLHEILKRRVGSETRRRSS